MTEPEWDPEDAHGLGVFLNGEEIPSHHRDGNPIEEPPFLLPFNGHHEPLTCTVAWQLGDG